MTELSQRRGGEVAREWVLACIDASSYDNSVCDHAAWFASHHEVGVEVLHVVEPGIAKPTDLPKQLVRRAIERLEDEGVGPLASATISGSFVDVVAGMEAGIVVIGKRGLDSGAERSALGANIGPIIHQNGKPVCLAPKVFLPIHRAVVLVDADTSQRTAIEFIVSDARIAALSMDVAVIAGPGEDADQKLQWARRKLSGVTADVFVLPSDGLDAAIVQYMQSRAADLIVLSRAVIDADPRAQLLRIEESGLWSIRTPILIC